MSSSRDVRKLINFLVIALVIMGGGVALGVSGVLSKDAPSIANSVLTTAETDYNFGNIQMYDGKVSKVFTLGNSGKEDVKFTDIRTSCMCTEAVVDNAVYGMHGPYFSSAVIKPGEKKEVTVIFDPLAHGPEAVGPITRVVSIKTNSAATPMVEFKIAGNVVR